MEGKTPVDEAVLRSLVERGLTQREIAREIDRSLRVTQSWLLRFGLKTQRASRRSVPAGVARIPGRCDIHGDVQMVRRSDGGWRCRTCRMEGVSRRRREVKRILVEEAGGACQICGYDRCLAALEFHHVDPATKAFGLADAGRTHALSRLRAERAKCVLICSNCHAEVEAGLTRLADALTNGLQPGRAPADPSLESPPSSAG